MTSSPGDESWWFKRYDAKGAENTNWNKSFSTGTKISRSYGLRLDEAGSVYVFGETGEIDRRGTFGWVRKFDPDGREQIAGWDKIFPNGGERRPTMAVVDMAVDSAGSLCVLLNLVQRLLPAEIRPQWTRALEEGTARGEGLVDFR